MGKLFVIEGTDGSGKATQVELLRKRLSEEGMNIRKISFPQYDSDSSALIKMYLHGDFGTNPSDVNPFAASVFYAVDRYASFAQRWGKDYNNGDIIIADRYTTSNAVHQAAKLTGKEQIDFFQWLYGLEFGRMGLPKPDCVIYLDVPTHITERLMRKREHDTNTKADIHEKASDYLRISRETGLKASAYYGWHVVNCAKNDELRTIQDIHEEVYSIVQKYIKEV